MAQNKNLNLELSLSQYVEDDPWVLKKKLSDSDLYYSAQLYLPKQEMEHFVLPEMDHDLVRKLGAGVEVKVRDVDSVDDFYTVRLKVRNGQYYLGKGWGLIKNAKVLNTGDHIGLFWDKLTREVKFKHFKSQSITMHREAGTTSTQKNVLQKK
ncbi:B3 domain-containing protein [Arabidopsis thaliana]|uniref:B3 domain-containing protein At1g10455 n=3 Tax=Arabidopsis TaxID=3701 RepID=Y1045_ARATH|eukprot:NP_683297.1 B3 DNA-binding domain protein [Arabidopsis thaliana]